MIETKTPRTRFVIGMNRIPIPDVKREYALLGLGAYTRLGDYTISSAASRRRIMTLVAPDHDAHGLIPNGRTIIKSLSVRMRGEPRYMPVHSTDHPGIVGFDESHEWDGNESAPTLTEPIRLERDDGTGFDEMHIRSGHMEFDGGNDRNRK